VIGYAQTSSSLRGFYLTGALEIEGEFDPTVLQDAIAGALMVAEGLPTELLFDILRFRINPVRADGTRISIGYKVKARDEEFTLTLRNSVLQVQPKLVNDVDVQVELSRETLNRLFDGEETYESAIEKGDVVIDGKLASLNEFFSVMDKREELPTPNLALR
jgi:alkyl sulfatase BDS1-like metallo-beta-lactamase superfamily hydrolase